MLDDVLDDVDPRTVREARLREQSDEEEAAVWLRANTCNQGDAVGVGQRIHQLHEPQEDFVGRRGVEGAPSEELHKKVDAAAARAEYGSEGLLELGAVQCVETRGNVRADGRASNERYERG